MMKDLGANRLSPWISVWLRPRETIERIVGDVSTRQILFLAALSGFAGIAGYLIQLGVITELRDWRLLLGAVLVGVFISMIQLFAVAILIAWFGLQIGEQCAEPAEGGAIVLTLLR